jgi:hypothetical protein
VVWAFLGAAVIGDVHAQATAVPLRELFNARELDDTIEAWRAAREAYGREWFKRKIGVSIEKSAKDYVIAQYLGSEITMDYLTQPTWGKEVIRADVEAVMNASYTSAIRAKGDNVLALGFLRLRSGEFTTIVIAENHVLDALQRSDCRVIPCDRRKCGNLCATVPYREFIGGE